MPVLACWRCEQQISIGQRIAVFIYGEERFLVHERCAVRDDVVAARGVIGFIEDEPEAA